MIDYNLANFIFLYNIFLLNHYDIIYVIFKGMKKIPIDKMIDFRRKKSDSTRFTVLHKTQEEKVKKPEETGGHYWVCCLSAANNVFKTDDKKHLDLKIDQLRQWIDETDHEQTKIRWEQSIKMIANLEDYDFKNIKPSSKLKLLKKPSDKQILKINDILIEANPDHVYSFTNNDSEEVGAVWFIAKKGGFEKSELAMFCDVIYRFLNIAFSEKFKINPDYCTAVDLANAQDVNYSQLLNGNINYLLESTIEDVKSALAKLNYR